MKFFIDTANVEEIRTANSWGLIDGVTTNPSLIAREKSTIQDIIPQIVEIGDWPLSVEVTGNTYEEMIEQGRGFKKYGKNVVVKLPMTQDGLKATRTLTQEDIKVNVTLIFSPLQGLMAAKAGATYASPFVGRLDDIGHHGMQLIGDLVNIYENYQYPTEVLVASVRSPMHVVDAANLGAGVATIPFNVLEKLFRHPLTDLGIERFMQDAAKSAN
jgi:transaldolase